jgi:nucleolar protein 58
LSGRKNFVIGNNVTNTTYSLKLKSFQKFDSAATALEEAASIMEGKVTPRLASLLDGIKEEKKVYLAVADVKLGVYP